VLKEGHRLSGRRTNPGYLTNGETAKESIRLQEMVRGIAGSGESPKLRASKFIATPRFWGSYKGRVVKAIIIDRAYTVEAVLKATQLNDKYVEWALRELIRDEIVEIKEGGKLWVVRELYWQCQNFFNPSSTTTQIDNLPISKPTNEKDFENHLSRKEFLFEFFGNFGRDLGNPERRFTTNPTELAPFIEECTRNKTPAFISVQPKKHKAQPFGLEKVFFDFDYCENSEVLTETETQKRKSELIDEVKHFLNYLELQNIKPLVIRTRKGYHVHVFFDSVYEINREVVFWKQVYKQLQLALLQDYNYRFIDCAVIGDINRMCRIPFSIHERSGVNCPVVNSQLETDKIRSIEYFKLYGLKQKDILSAMEKAREFKKTTKKRRLTYVPRNLSLESADGIRPCFVKALDSGEMCHQQRLALLSEAYHLGFHSPESIIDLYRCLNDFDYSITTYQVNWFFNHWVEKGEITPYSCQTIQRNGWCLGDECPRLNR
jgi:hypothetical protein